MRKLSLSPISLQQNTADFYYNPFGTLLEENVIERWNCCVFCKIAHGKDPDTDLLYKDNNYVAFRSIKPAASHHYLVVPKNHIKDAVGLKPHHIPMLEQMEYIGKEVLSQLGGDLNSSRLGYHWPPFISVPHLHLHVISPECELSSRSHILFKPGTRWFRTTNQVISKLNTRSLVSTL
ncbi:adenosine 5'-monophosphoramidase HINT3 [Parasteatoda tepidariorum]|uniref:adenosine 5'-monophosphoramidase HINT3 n=1 Tax=Parasteatoda tepidariorum TaxID=114398 RepID=UPI001C71BAAB|nr:histidine triad nucleotide-binding protein 3 [Parasteatoda tepidariorum]